MFCLVSKVFNFVDMGWIFISVKVRIQFKLIHGSSLYRSAFSANKRGGLGRFSFLHFNHYLEIVVLRLTY